jgi:hypothetical protein
MSKWATDAQIADALARWPRDVADAVHVRQIMRETGLSEVAAQLALDLARGDSEGDVIELDERPTSEPT